MSNPCLRRRPFGLWANFRRRNGGCLVSGRIFGDATAAVRSLGGFSETQRRPFGLQASRRKKRRRPFGLRADSVEGNGDRLVSGLLFFAHPDPPPKFSLKHSVLFGQDHRIEAVAAHVLATGSLRAVRAGQTRPRLPSGRIPVAVRPTRLHDALRAEAGAAALLENSSEG